MKTVLKFINWYYTNSSKNTFWWPTGMIVQ